MRLVNVIAITIVCLVGVRQLEAATLAWDSNPEPVLGYVVSYGTQSGVHSTSVDVGRVVTYVLSPPSGQRYYIVVQAYNEGGLGPKSAEVVLDLAMTTVVNQAPTLTQPAESIGIGRQCGDTCAVRLRSREVRADVQRHRPAARTHAQHCHRRDLRHAANRRQLRRDRDRVGRIPDGVAPVYLGSPRRPRQRIGARTSRESIGSGRQRHWRFPPLTGRRHSATGATDATRDAANRRQLQRDCKRVRRSLDGVALV